MTFRHCPGNALTTASQMDFFVKKSMPARWGLGWNLRSRCVAHGHCQIWESGGEMESHFIVPRQSTHTLRSSFLPGIVAQRIWRRVPASKINARLGIDHRCRPVIRCTRDGAWNSDGVFFWPLIFTSPFSTTPKGRQAHRPRNDDTTGTFETGESPTPRISLPCLWGLRRRFAPLTHQDVSRRFPVRTTARKGWSGLPFQTQLQLVRTE